MKLAALIPDEAIEEDAEVSKGIKEHFNIIMRHKDERGQTIRDMKSKVAINRENFYKKKSRRHLKAVIDHSDKFDTYRTMRERLESTLGELNEEIEYTAISKNGVPLHSNYVDTEVIR